MGLVKVLRKWAVAEDFETDGGIVGETVSRVARCEGCLAWVLGTQLEFSLREHVGFLFICLPVFSSFETGSLYEALAVLKLTMLAQLASGIHPPLPSSQCWD